jgi:hypothetical protein
MHLAAKTDIDAPADYVFRALMDFDGWEKSAMRRGADVRRTDNLRQVGPGMTWSVAFDMRGKRREMNVALVETEQDKVLIFKGDSSLLMADLKMDLVALSPKLTRLVVKTDIKPQTLGARLFIQSMKLAKGRVEAKLALRLGQLASEIEARYGAKPPR